MKLSKTKFNGLVILERKSFNDSRGNFTEFFNEKLFNKLVDTKVDFLQDNIVNSTKNVLRGLHYQFNPFAQSKLISVIKGEIFDVVVDIRNNSSTYGQFFSVNLSSENNLSLFVPNGFAHGYLSLTSETIVHYKVDNYYNKDFEDGIRYNDSFLNINWGVPIDDLIISDKDKNLPDFKW